MVVVVEVVSPEKPRPAAGAPVIVQLRDTTYQDAAATVLAEARGVVGGSGDTIASVEVAVEATVPETTVWAHVDVDRDDRVSRGDYVTTQSFPVPAGAEPRVRVLVKRV